MKRLYITGNGQGGRLYANPSAECSGVLCFILLEYFGKQLT